MLDDLPRTDLEAIERQTQSIGRFLFDHLQKQQPSVLERRWWDDRIMAWAMQDESVKVQMFRFIDVLPMLTTSEAVIEHLHEYFNEVREALPSAVRVGMAVVKPRSIAGRALAIAARRNASSHARRFIAGSNIAEVIAAARRQRKLGRAFTLDILGEAVISDVEAERFLRSYVELIEGIAPAVNAWPDVPQIDQGVTGTLPRVNISVKLSALDSQFDAIDHRGSTERASARLRELLRVARGHRAFINVDMESYKVKDLTLHVFKQVMMEDEFRECGDVGIVIQAYLTDAEKDLVELRDWAARRGHPVWVRLVKGAYWDYETVHAKATGWPIPVFQQKPQSDITFERLTRFVMQNYKHLRTALGSHNIRSLAHGIAVAEHFEIPKHGYELQMLYGMGDAEKQVLVDRGHRLRIYMPYGELIPGMAYLVRRLLENTSNDSFLRASFAEQVAPEILLMNPIDELARATPPEEEIVSGFQNEPPLDFSKEANRRAMSAALAEVKSQLGGHYPLVIGGQEIDTEQRDTSHNPAEQTQVIGTTASATAEQASDAVRAAREAGPAWAALDVETRADYLRRAAEVMRQRRFELAAWAVYECAKEWREADGEVCEAIDFCEYYAEQAVAMNRPHGCDVPGQENRFEYLPRGVVAVIAPWNFPLAILTGMTAAALVTGNTVVMKPAEQSPVMAAKLMEIMGQIELPSGVLNYLPGPGEVAGAALVEHPDVALIVFTGSRDVGLAINAKAAEISTKSTTGVKRVIAEMGGKNALIIDADADLDEAVLGVVHSAFGYQGQKCSACSRAIVLESVYDMFLDRLVEATRSLKVGLPEDPATSVGPVIDQDSLDRIGRYIKLGRQEGREALAVDVGELAERGYFVGPHIFADVPPTARLAQEEIFGPVLAVIKAKDLDDALRIANGTDYALTAGIFSRNPAHLKRAARELMAGNVYLNQQITGAQVARQPFGGFKLSGIGSKAGGPDYLIQFVVPRTVTENTMRRGFAPEAVT